MLKKLSPLFLLSSILISLSLNTYCQITSGTYTIGGTTPDYASFSAAVSDLNTNGLAGDGAVVFDVRDGTYTENISLTQITNASLASNITFKSENSDKTLVILQFTTSSSDKAVIVLDGTDYISIEHMTIQALGSSYTGVVHLLNGATNNDFSNCNLIGENLSSGTGYAESIVYSTSTATLDINNKFDTNVFSQGSHGICFLGSGTNIETGNEITNNEFVNQTGYTLRLNYQDGIIITGNSISSDKSTTWNGIYLNYCEGALEIAYNKIWKITAGQGYGMNLNQCKATSGARSSVYNNFVYMRGTTGNGYCIYSNYCDYIDFYYNNLSSSHTSTSQSSFRVNGGQVGTGTVRIKNNVFVNTSGGYAIYVGTTAGIEQIDNNDYCVAGTNLGYWSGAKTDMTAWTGATGETNSLNLDPSFIDDANGDLHISNSSLEAAGVDITTVLDDIDATARPNPSTIGAHETGTATGPAITLTGSLTAFETSVGTPTSAQTFTVEGINLTEDILITPPTRFQVQEQGVGPWANSVTLTESSGTVSITTIETRYNPVSAGSHSGNIACTSSGATTKNIAIEGRSTNCSSLFQGTYTINPGAAASCTNYQSISDAVSDLISGTRSDDDTYYHGPGVDGIVYFDIASGTYVEQIKIDNISGTYDSIVFKSATRNHNDVIIEYSCPQDGDINNYVLRLDGAQYVTIRDVTIQSVGVGTSYTKVIDLTGGASNNKITNNNLIGKTTISQSNDRQAVVASSNDFNNTNNEISNNTITNGSHGVYFSGIAFNNLESGTYIYKNNIVNSEFTGIHFQNQDAAIALGNIINTNSTRTDFNGIYAYYADNATKIQKNQINASSAYGNGIYFYLCDGTAGGYGETSNNMVFIGAGGGTTNYGILLNQSDYQNIYYNTSVSNSSSTLNSGELNCAFKSWNTCNNQVVINNIFYNLDAGLAVFIDIAASIEEMDYNNLYTSTGAVLGRWVTTSSADATLASWQTVTPGALDDNSISADPKLVSNSDLHLQEGSPCIDMATDLVDVTDDIDDESRATDIGSDEYSAALPVELLSFTATSKADKLVLNWITASEVNNDFFTIEKIKNQECLESDDWEIVAIVKSAGDINAISNYESFDFNPYQGKSYYRLKQTDFDGKYEYSDMLAVYFNPKFDNFVLLYPNPADDFIYLEIQNYDGAKVNVNIINLQGEIMFNKDLDSDFEQIDISDFPNGVYFVKVISSMNYKIEKIVKTQHRSY